MIMIMMMMMIMIMIMMMMMIMIMMMMMIMIMIMIMIMMMMVVARVKGKLSLAARTTMSRLDLETPPVSRKRMQREQVDSSLRFSKKRNRARVVRLCERGRLKCCSCFSRGKGKKVEFSHAHALFQAVHTSPNCC